MVLAFEWAGWTFISDAPFPEQREDKARSLGHPGILKTAQCLGSNLNIQRVKRGRNE